MGVAASAVPALRRKSRLSIALPPKVMSECIVPAPRRGIWSIWSKEKLRRRLTISGISQPLEIRSLRVRSMLCNEMRITGESGHLAGVKIPMS